jgi:glycosyltransferase involved in cell wall biosynthesis
MPDIVTDESDGLLFDPACPLDGAARVLARWMTLRPGTALGASARRAAEGFSWERAAEGLLAAACSARTARHGRP